MFKLVVDLITDMENVLQFVDHDIEDTYRPVEGERSYLPPIRVTDLIF